MVVASKTVPGNCTGVKTEYNADKRDSPVFVPGDTTVEAEDGKAGESVTIHIETGEAIEEFASAHGDAKTVSVDV